MDYTLTCDMIIILQQRLQIEEYGSCEIIADQVDATNGSLDIYNLIILVILLGLTFVISLFNSQNAFLREAVRSFWAVTVALIPLPTVHVVRLFLLYHEPSHSNQVKTLEPILWIQFLDNVCAAILIMLLLFGPSVSS